MLWQLVRLKIAPAILFALRSMSSKLPKAVSTFAQFTYWRYHRSYNSLIFSLNLHPLKGVFGFFARHYPLYRLAKREDATSIDVWFPCLMISGIVWARFVLLLWEPNWLAGPGKLLIVHANEARRDEESWRTKRARSLHNPPASLSCQTKGKLVLYNRKIATSVKYHWKVAVT